MSEITNETIIERIEGFKTLINEKFDVNGVEHSEIKTRLDHTNGTIKSHDKILWGLGGGLTIISMLFIPILMFILNNYWGGVGIKANEQAVAAQAENKIDNATIEKIVEETLSRVKQQ